MLYLDKKIVTLCGEMSARVELPVKQYAAYIFDLDGTLVDSMPLHHRAWRQALQQAGAPEHVFLEEEFYACGGKSAQDVVRFLNEIYHLDLHPEQVANQKRHIYLEMLHQHGVQVITPVIDFVKTLHAPKAIATGSAIQGAKQTLAAAGIQDLFKLILTPQDVSCGKPAPDMFLKAAQLLGVNPADCVVFEDAAPGMQAAAAAGMDCVQVRRV